MLQKKIAHKKALLSPDGKASSENLIYIKVWLGFIIDGFLLPNYGFLLFLFWAGN